MVYFSRSYAHAVEMNIYKKGVRNTDPLSNSSHFIKALVGQDNEIVNDEQRLRL